MNLRSCTFICRNNINLLIETFKRIYDENININSCVINRFNSNILVNLDLELSDRINLSELIRNHQIILENTFISYNNYNSFSLLIINYNVPELLCKLFEIIINNNYILDNLELKTNNEITLKIKTLNNITFEIVKESFLNVEGIEVF